MSLASLRHRRICVAIQQNMQQWLDELWLIENAAPPGEKNRILNLLNNMTQASHAIGRIMAEEQEMACGVTGPGGRRQA